MSRIAMPRRPTSLLVIALFLLLTALLTWPVAIHFITHVPGDGRDDPPLVWNTWWIRYALLNLHTNPFSSSYLFYPLRINLVFYTLTLFNGVMAVPLDDLLGIVGATNAMLFFSFTMAGLGVYLLGLRTLRNVQPDRTRRLAAVMAGLVYAFAPIKLIFASLGQFNFTSNEWIPFFVLYLLRSCEAPGRRRDAILAGIFLVLTGLCEFTLASFLIVFTGLYVVYRLISEGRTALSRKAVGNLAVTAGVFAMGFSPIILAMLQEIQEEGDYTLTVGWGFADAFSADLLGFFIPSHLHPLFGPWAAQATSSFSYTNFSYLGVAALALALVGARRSGWRHAFWPFATLSFIIISLGPVLHIAGRWVFDLDGLLVRVPLPFIILHYIPFIKANRYPSRYGIMVALSLGILAAQGMAVLLHRLGPRQQVIVGVGLFLIVLFDYLAVPLPLSDLRSPTVYEAIARNNGGAPLLQLPLSWRNSFAFIPQKLTEYPQAVNAVVMFQQFYQTVHQGPILSGNTSRNPELSFVYYLEAPIIRSLVALEEGRRLSLDEIEADRRIADEVVRFFGFKYVVIHPPYVDSPLEDYVRAVFPVTPIPADSGLHAYRVATPAVPIQTTIQLDSDSGRLYRGQGWGEPDDAGGCWSERRLARLMIPMQPGRSARLTLTARSAGTQTMTVQVNGQTVGRATVGPQWAEYMVVVPASVVRAGLNDVIILSDPLLPLPYALRPLGTTGVQTATTIVVRSAGLDAGGDSGFAHIVVNGHEVIQGRRGYNLAIIYPETGKVMATGTFDTFRDPAASARLAQFIANAPDGSIVAAAVMDEASMNLGDEAVQALRSIGAEQDLRGRFRASHAIIGVKGATPGQAIEAVARGRPAQVAVGPNVMRAQVGIAVRTVMVDQSN
jgi:hypothetical protein